MANVHDNSPHGQAPTPLVVADEELGRRAARDSTAFAELYRRYLPRVYRYALAQLGDPHQAQDVTSQTFLSAMVLLALLLITPQVRASMGNVIRIGAVRIGLAPATTAAPAPSPPYTGPVPTPLPSLLDLAGATTLDQARTQARFPVRLPAYPPDLGAPQYVFLQNLNGPMVALVWVDPVHPSSVRLALFELSSDLYIYKSGATIVTQTTVHGQLALWTEGPYLVQVIENGQVAYATRVLVNGHALIWTEGDITYRVETSASLDEAVKIAESLHGAFVALVTLVAGVVSVVRQATASAVGLGYRKRRARLCAVAARGVITGFITLSRLGRRSLGLACAKPGCPHNRQSQLRAPGPKYHHMR